jgi:hypothetical protein
MRFFLYILIAVCLFELIGMANANEKFAYNARMRRDIQKCPALSDFLSIRT